MKKPGPVIDPDKCNPSKCNHGNCLVVPVCSMKMIIQEESDEMPIILGPCKSCGKCVATCPFGAISLY